MSRGRRKKCAGFTLLEVLIVVAILGLLATIVAVNLAGRVEESKVTKARLQIAEFKKAIELFKLDTGRYPTAEEGLGALVKKPADAKKWKKGGYLDGTDKVPQDPWQNPYVYVYGGSEDKKFTLISYGVDGNKGGEGYDADISSRDTD